MSPRYNLVHFLIQERRLVEARRELEAALSLFPAATGEFAYLLALIDLFEGDPEAAATAAEMLPEETERLHEKTALLAMAWEGLGLTDRSVEARTRLERTPDEWAALRVAEVHAYAGDEEQAFAWLRVAMQRAAGDSLQRYRFWGHVAHSPFLSELQDDPRWRSLQTEADALMANAVGAG